MNTEILVVALEVISEENFAGVAEFVHALPGDEGDVEDVDVDQACATVTWRLTGTTTTCHVSEFCLATDPRAAVLRGRRSN